MNEFIRDKNGWCILMYRFAEEAEARIEKINGTIRRLYDEGLVDRTGFLGGVFEMALSSDGDESSRPVVQSALLVPEGLGVVIRHPEELRHGLSLTALRERFAPIGAIKPLQRLAFLPCATMLLTHLEDRIGD